MECRVTRNHITPPWGPFATSKGLKPTSVRNRHTTLAPRSNSERQTQFLILLIYFGVGKPILGDLYHFKVCWSAEEISTHPRETKHTLGYIRITGEIPFGVPISNSSTHIMGPKLGSDSLRKHHRVSGTHKIPRPISGDVH